MKIGFKVGAVAVLLVAAACGVRVLAQAGVGGAVVTDPAFKVTLTLPADARVEPSRTQTANDELQITNGSTELWANVSPAVTGTASASAVTTAAPVVSYADSAVARLDAGLMALYKLDGVVGGTVAVVASTGASPIAIRLSG